MLTTEDEDTEFLYLSLGDVTLRLYQVVVVCHVSLLLPFAAVSVSTIAARVTCYNVSHLFVTSTMFDVFLSTLLLETALPAYKQSEIR